MADTTFTAFFPFGGLGAGARGFLDAQVTMLGHRARFESLGGIDNDPLACEDFEYLTGTPELCRDVSEMTPADLVEFAGRRAPDVVFMSPPCKGFSGLLGKKAAAKDKYSRMNRLVLDWIELMLAAWGDDPPGLVLLENVPRIASRGAPLLKKVRALLRKAGYVFHQQSHDCGELGGLAQRRRRFLLVARLPRRVPPLLYQPPAKRVRACGEVLGELPMPEDPTGGPLHRMPRISWLSWVRLALIPAGGDWRDLPGVLEAHQARREVHKRHAVEAWHEPTGTISGSGSNAVGAVADPRVGARMGLHHNKMRVEAWTSPGHTVTGSDRIGSGAPSIAHPRLGCTPRAGAYGLIPWEEAAKTVIGNARVDNGPWAVCDPRIPDGEPVIIIRDPRKPPSAIPVIAAEDGTWHRPMTTLELAALQGLPTGVDGRPLELAGKNVSSWRERIGNAVPCPTACAIAEQMLVALVESEADAFSMHVGTVWVDSDRMHLEPPHA